MPEDRPERPVISSEVRRSHLAYLNARAVVEEWDHDLKMFGRITKLTGFLSLPVATTFSVLQATSHWPGWTPLAWVGWLAFVAACVIVVMFTASFTGREKAYRQAKARILEYEEYELEPYKLLKQRIAMWDLAYGMEDEFG